MSRRVLLSVAIVAMVSASAHAVPFNEPFDVDTASTAATQAAYPDFTLTLNGAASANVIVNGGVLLIEPDGAAGEQLFTRAGMAGDHRLSIDVGASASNGSYNAGLRIGNNNIGFHPGFAGAALRVEGVGGFGNTNVGFTPANGTLHHLDVDVFSNGLHRVTLTDGDTMQSFVTSFFNPASLGGAVGPRREGPTTGDGRYDNFTSTAPVLGLQALVDEPFNIDAADTGAFNAAYPQIDTSVLGGGSVTASGGIARVAGSGANTDQLLNFGAFEGELLVTALVGGTSDPGGWNAGLRIGENNITFHPGFAGGAFRVEGPNGFGNTNVGFTPGLNELHELRVHVLEDGLFRIYLQNAADPSQVFSASFMNLASVGGDISLRRSGPTGGQALFGGLTIEQFGPAAVIPEPATALLALMGLAVLGRRRSRVRDR